MLSITLKGIIIRVYGKSYLAREGQGSARAKNFSGENFAYTLHDGEHSVEFTGRQFFQPGESVKVLCGGEEKFGKTVLVAEKMEKTADMYPEIEKKISEGAKFIGLGDFDGATAKMKPDFERFARKIYAAQQLNRHMTVKFHGDADGISSALILKKFLRANYVQQNSAIYSVGDAIRDMERMGQQFRPLLILLDFGSGEDSAEGLKLAKAGGMEIISVDHHPPYQESASCFSLSVNPWNAGIEDGSKYPVGFLCSLLAGTFGIDGEWLEKIACAGDKSGIIRVSKEDSEKALALDFVATYSGFGNGIDFYSEVLSRPELFNSVLLQANAKLEEADRLLKANLKGRSAPKAEIYWFNLDAIAEKREFPNKGKITGRVFEITGGKKPMVAIGYGKRTIILRINDEAVANGIRGNEIIGQMKTRFSDFVENGGGHARAAALRIKEGFENAAVEEIIKIIGH